MASAGSLFDPDVGCGTARRVLTWGCETGPYGVSPCGSNTDTLAFHFPLKTVASDTSHSQ